MLPEKVHQSLVPTLVLAPDLLIRELGTGGHEAVNLLGKGLDLAGYLQRLLKGLDGLGVFVLGGEYAHGHGNSGSVSRVDHGRVSFRRGGELAVRAAGVGDDL